MRPIKITIPGRPITKKNSGRMIRVHGRTMLMPSKQFVSYQELAGNYIHSRPGVAERVNVRCRYYMPTRGIVDLVGLLQATDDILVHYGVLEDDNSRIVAAHDGSRVLYDKQNPRAEITIARMEEDES